MTGVSPDTEPAFRATLLTDEQLGKLRRKADGASRRFTDPVQMRRVKDFIAGRLDWAAAVLGHPFNMHLGPYRDVILLDLAAAVEPQPPQRPRPPAPWEPGYQPTQDEQDQAAFAQASREAWNRLSKALYDTVGLQVRVTYNYSGPRHGETYESGAEHILVAGNPLKVGRLERAPGQSLCQTKSRAKHLLFDRRHKSDDARTPSCKDCVRRAYRLAGIEFDDDDVLLVGKRGRRPASTTTRHAQEYDDMSTTSGTASTSGRSQLVAARRGGTS